MKPEVNEETELWREYRRAQQQRRESRLPSRAQAILALLGKGFAVKELTPYQFRVDGQLDLFPIHQRYHFLPRNLRGRYRNPIEVVMKLLRGSKS